MPAGARHGAVQEDHVVDDAVAARRRGAGVRVVAVVAARLQHHLHLPQREARLASEAAHVEQLGVVRAREHLGSTRIRVVGGGQDRKVGRSTT